MSRAFQAALLAVGSPAIVIACSSGGAKTGPVKGADGGPAAGDATTTSFDSSAEDSAAPDVTVIVDSSVPVDANDGAIAPLGGDASSTGCYAGAYELDAGPDANPLTDVCAYIYLCGLPGDLVPVGCNVLARLPSGGTGPIAGMSCYLPDDAGCDDDVYTPTVDGSVTVLCTPCPAGGGRRPTGLRKPRAVKRANAPNVLAGYLAQMAFEEDASVAAFARMARELASLGAPGVVATGAARAEADERRHQRSMAKLARAHAGDVARAKVRAPKGRRAAAIAAENAAEGCVRETYGALLARWQSLHAQDPHVRRAFTRVASDEATHAALSWAVARWLEPTLDAAGKQRVARARERALAKLRASACVEPPRALVEAAGLPTAKNARALVEALFARPVAETPLTRASRPRSPPP